MKIKPYLPIIIFLIVFGIFSYFFLYFFTDINFNFYLSITTVLVGLFAIYLYIQQKEDTKKDAANIILVEIQNAERVLTQIAPSIKSNPIVLPSDKFLLPNNSWNQYKYLFVKDLDRDEWDTITQFYNNCKLYDEAVLYNNSLFQKNEEQIRINMLRASADYLKEYIRDNTKNNEDEKEKFEKETLKKAKDFHNKYLNMPESLSYYSPQKPLNDGKNAFESIKNNISQTSVGVKLKKLSGLKI
jgi:hypothetical protein